MKLEVGSNSAGHMMEMNECTSLQNHKEENRDIVRFTVLTKMKGDSESEREASVNNKDNVTQFVLNFFGLKRSGKKIEVVSHHGKSIAVRHRLYV
ncbi:unnamed protein product [Sphenostylis stenocarpa]|uniref:Uncharacterized protein n=1 Tax=Sphenostylis stenocarpa TaxID=92480 RepID=A0AA86W129_9FABA|nr:unnamed protein product [Sphenostylis stenocarpa]